MAETTGLEPATSGVTGRDCEVVSDSPADTSIDTVNSVAPIVAPAIQREVILDALKAMDRTDLLALLAEALTGKGPGT